MDVVRERTLERCITQINCMTELRMSTSTYDEHTSVRFASSALDYFLTCHHESTSVEQRSPSDEHHLQDAIESLVVVNANRKDPCRTRLNSIMTVRESSTASHLKFALPPVLNSSQRNLHQSSGDGCVT